MRIVAGKWGGRRLASPGGRAVRPTADRVREALFSILGERVAGARVLDLFAGTGALGLEALSRGAASAVFVESDPEAFAVLSRNVTTLGEEGTMRVRSDWRRAVRRFSREGARFSLVFLDPPYGKGIAAAAARAIGRGGLAEPGAAVVVEESSKEPPGNYPPEWRVAAERRYGDTLVTVFTTEKEPE